MEGLALSCPIAEAPGGTIFYLDCVKALAMIHGEASTPSLRGGTAGKQGLALEIFRPNSP